MTSLPPPDPAAYRLDLPVNGATVSASAFRDDLVDALDRGGPTAIDGSAVQTIGQAVLQLLLAARHQATAAGTTLTITNPSQPFVEMARSCALAEAIGLDSEKVSAA